MRIKVNNCGGFSGVIDIVGDQVTVQSSQDWPKIPEDSNDRIIFRRVPGQNKFDMSSYSLNQTDGHLTQAELEAFMGELYQIIVKNKFSGNRFTKRYCFSFLLMMIAIIVGSILPAFIDLFAITMVIILVPTFFFIIIISLQTSALIKAQKKIQIQAKEVAERETKRINGKGLKWVVPDHFPIWIELKLEYRASLLQSTGDINGLIDGPGGAQLGSQGYTFNEGNQNSGGQNNQNNNNQGNEYTSNSSTRPVNSVKGNDYEQHTGNQGENTGNRV